MVKYKRLEEQLAVIGEQLKETYKEKLQQGGISATGKLFNSVNYRLEVTEEGTKIYFQAEDYWINIEEGRAPNSKMPPVEEIRKWMITRGIPDKPGTAFIIARSIGIKGIKPNPILRESRVEIKQYEVELKNALNKDIKEHLDKNIRGKISEQIKKN